MCRPIRWSWSSLRSRLQLRVSLLSSVADLSPTLKFLGVSLLDDHVQPPALEPNRAVWGKEIAVPGRTQLGWPGGSGWCKPDQYEYGAGLLGETAGSPRTGSERAGPPPMPSTTASTTETGNWPFNTAFAGSFPGIRAYVTRPPTFENWKTGWKSVSPRSSPSPMIC